MGLFVITNVKVKGFDFFAMVLGNLLGVAIIQAYFNVKIIYTDDYFIYSTFWGKKYKFRYDEIKNIYRKKELNIWQSMKLKEKI